VDYLPQELAPRTNTESQPIVKGYIQMPNEDELELVAEPEEDEEYIQYDIATYPSDYTLSGIQEL
jgi:hypothetical protein